MAKFFKSIWFYILLGLALLLIVGGGLIQRRLTQLAPSPTIADSPTSIIGFNHIGISVKDLDQMIDFYQKATGFEVIKRYQISNDSIADILYDQENISFETAILKGPNMLLELTEFDGQSDELNGNMPPQGPGMTHTCYQSKSEDSGFHKFKNAGASILTRGSEPIDLGGYGVTYAYGYDPEGNMMELEQMSNFIIWLKIGSDYAEQNPMWMTQVAIMSPNLERLTSYYETVLGIAPYRVSEYGGIAEMDDIIDHDSTSLKSAWFMLDSQEKKMELMQYLNPVTPELETNKKVTDLGYSYSLEVEDIQAEYQRLKDKGIDFLSSPQKMEDFWTVMARDVDGNFYALRQAIDPNSIYSIKNF